MSAVTFPMTISRPHPSARTYVVIALVVLAALSVAYLHLGAHSLVPSAPGARIAERFFASALHPAVKYESEVPAGTPPLLMTAMSAAATTVVIASAAMSLAVVIGLLLAFVAS